MALAEQQSEALLGCNSLLRDERMQGKQCSTIGRVLSFSGQHWHTEQALAYLTPNRIAGTATGAEHALWRRRT
jgi:hypothetical protein